MDERYLTSFEDQTSALGYTSGGTTLVSPQVSLIGDEVVFSKKIPNESNIRFAKDETTGRLYFVVDGVYYDVTVLVKKNIPVPSEGYGEVDLGLSVKWADRNVGAENPWDNGAYFSLGNVEGVVFNGRTTKISEDDLIEQYIIFILSVELGVEPTPEQIEEFKNNPEFMEQVNAMVPMVIGLISGYSFNANTYSTTFGGQYTGSELDAEHDAATVNMGDGWHMPTSAETVELVENTDHYYIGEDGNIVSESELDVSKKLRSICFVKKGEGFDYNDRSNFIEFPFAGMCVSSLYVGDGSDGNVWTSSVCGDSGETAPFLGFNNGGLLGGGVENYCMRYGGQSVRGVRA